MKRMGGLGNLFLYTKIRPRFEIHLHQPHVLRNSFQFYSKFAPERFGNVKDPSTLELARRIWKVGRQETAIASVLDEWVKEEGLNISKVHLVIRTLSDCQRHSSALEITKWLTGQKGYDLSSAGAAIQLKLIAKEHGIKQSEDYFKSVKKKIKDHRVYSALLRSFAEAKSVEKAELLMQEMKELGIARGSEAYNAMLSLYHKTRKTEKFDALVQEMDENKIGYTRYLYQTLLQAYADRSNIDEMKKILTRMEFDRSIVLSWKFCTTVATLCSQVGLDDTAVEMLQKSEGLIDRHKFAAYKFLMGEYARLGNKDGYLRIWDVYKKEEGLKPKHVLHVLSFLLEADDVENAERVVEEWKSLKLQYNMRIPGILVSAYIRKGFLEKAETLVSWQKSSGLEPCPISLFHLALAYVQNGQQRKAAETIKKIVFHNPKYETLATSIECLKGDGDEKAKCFIRLLKKNGFISAKQCKLLGEVSGFRWSLIKDSPGGSTLEEASSGGSMREDASSGAATEEEASLGGSTREDASSGAATKEEASLGGSAAEKWSLGKVFKPWTWSGRS